MIINRPSFLEKIPFYKHLPKAPFKYDPSALPSILNFDIFELCGLLPITIDVSNLCLKGLLVQPSQKVVDYYCEKNIKFQMIFVVANFYDLKLENGIIRGRPYSISLVPASKRGKIDERDAKFASLLKLEEIENMGFIYLDFDPFGSARYGIFGNYGILMGTNGLKVYTDSIGFVINGYFLANTYNKNEILLANMPAAPKYIQEKYTQYRINHYFKPFKNLKPRKIWGVDSPIELFLIQALAAENLFPKIQTLIFKNGDIFPSFFEMVSSQSLTKDHELITEVDLFFTDKKVAVFCDSTRYHRSRKTKEKDQRISKSLEEIGIKSIRIKGSDIAKKLKHTVNSIKERL